MLGFLPSFVKSAIAGAVATFVMKQVNAFIKDKMHDHVDFDKAKEEADKEELQMVQGAVDMLPLELEMETKKDLAKAFNFGIGMAISIATSRLTRYLRRALGPAVGGGVAGVVIFVVGDELLKPLLGLAHHPGVYPAKTHLRGLLSHLAYGVTESKVRDLLA